MNQRGLFKLILLALLAFLVLSGFIVYNNIKKKVTDTLNGDIDVEEYKEAVKDIADKVVDKKPEAPIDEVISVQQLNASINTTTNNASEYNITNLTNTNT